MLGTSLLLADSALGAGVKCEAWPAWQRFKLLYMSHDGRIVDASTESPDHHLGRPVVCIVLRVGRQRPPRPSTASCAGPTTICPAASSKKYCPPGNGAGPMTALARARQQLRDRCRPVDRLHARRSVAPVERATLRQPGRRNRSKHSRARKWRQCPASARCCCRRQMALSPSDGWRLNASYLPMAGAARARTADQRTRSGTKSQSRPSRSFLARLLKDSRLTGSNSPRWLHP